MGLITCCDIRPMGMRSIHPSNLSVSLTMDSLFVVIVIHWDSHIPVES